MLEPRLDRLVYRRPVRLCIVFLSGLVLGPLIAYLMIHAPSNEWLGPYPPYTEDMTIVAVMIGCFCGMAVGLAMALLVLGAQRLKQHWSGPNPVPWSLGPETLPCPADKEIDSDERISRQTDIASSME